MPSPQEILRKYFSAGQVLAGRYELQSVLGSGAYGVIYTAADRISHETVAVKALPPQSESSSRTALQRFKREMNIIHNLVHPHIVTLYDFGETDAGIPYMVLEYIKGEQLDRLVADNPMEFADGLTIITQIASALASAHAQGIIHRDLKPANIMVQGRPGEYACKVLDFGMAKLLHQIGDESIAQLTREGVAVGTPRYIAPEQARGKEVGPYTDIYALGLLTYEVFSGARAVKHDSIEGAVMAHVNPEPLDLPELELVPELVRPIMHKMLEKKAADRYQRAEQVHEALERLASEHRKQVRGDLPVNVDARGRPIEAPKPYELDLERVEKVEQARYDRLRKDQVSAERAEPLVVFDKTFFKKPTRLWHLVEFFVGVVVALCGFWFLSVTFIVDPWIRLAVGFIPIAMGGLFGGLAHGVVPHATFSRGLILTGLLCALMPHLLRLEHLVAGLYTRADWFMSPFIGVPGAAALSEALRELGREWATIASHLL